jgi:RNA-directed DNA polymerase
MNVKDSMACKQLHENFTHNQLSLEWDSIDWQRAEQVVNRIQIRITKAILAGKHHLVKRLQYLMAHSYYAKALAVKKVTTNKGKRTPGIDGIIWSHSAQKMQAVHKLGNRNYIQTIEESIHRKIRQVGEASTKHPHHVRQSDASPSFTRP